MNDGTRPLPGSGSGQHQNSQMLGHLQLGHSMAHPASDPPQDLYSGMPGASAHPFHMHGSHRPASQMHAEQGPTVTPASHHSLASAATDGAAFAHPSSASSVSGTSYSMTPQLAPGGMMGNFGGSTLFGGEHGGAPDARKLPPLNAAFPDGNAGYGLADANPMGAHAGTGYPAPPSHLSGHGQYGDYYGSSSGLNQTLAPHLPTGIPPNQQREISEPRASSASKARPGRASNLSGGALDGSPVTTTGSDRGLEGSGIVLEAPARARVAPQKGPDGKKRYPCSYPGCDKTFSTSGHAARHSRIHTGQKPYRCTFPGCKARFSRQDNSLQHYRTHILAPKARPRPRQNSDIMMSPQQGHEDLRAGPSSGNAGGMTQSSYNQGTTSSYDDMRGEDDEEEIGSSTSRDLLDPSVALGKKALEEGTAIAVVHDVLDSKGRKKGESLERMVGAGGKQRQAPNWTGERAGFGIVRAATAAAAHDQASSADNTPRGDDFPTSSQYAEFGRQVHAQKSRGGGGGGSHDSASFGASGPGHRDGSGPTQMHADREYAIDPHLYDNAQNGYGRLSNGRSHPSEGNTYSPTDGARMSSGGPSMPAAPTQRQPPPQPRRGASEFDGADPAANVLDGPSNMQDFRLDQNSSTISGTGPTWMTTASAHGYGAWPGAASFPNGGGGGAAGTALPSMLGGPQLAGMPQNHPMQGGQMVDFSPVQSSMKSVQASPASLRGWNTLNDPDRAWEREREERMALFAEAGREAAQFDGGRGISNASGGPNGGSRVPQSPVMGGAGSGWANSAASSQRPSLTSSHQRSSSLSSSVMGMPLDGSAPTVNAPAPGQAGASSSIPQWTSDPHWRSAMVPGTEGSAVGESAAHRLVVNPSMPAPPLPTGPNGNGSGGGVSSRRQSTTARVSMSTSTLSSTAAPSPGVAPPATQGGLLLPPPPALGGAAGLKNLGPLSPTTSTASSALLSLSVLPAAVGPAPLLPGPGGATGPTIAVGDGPQQQGSGPRITFTPDRPLEDGLDAAASAARTAP